MFMKDYLLEDENYEYIKRNLNLGANDSKEVLIVDAPFEANTADGLSHLDEVCDAQWKDTSTLKYRSVVHAQHILHKRKKSAEEYKRELFCDWL